MKRIRLFIIVLICLFITNVKADMGPPSVIEHKAMVTNKNGAQCYEGSGKKTDKVIPYGTTIDIYDDINSSGYIYLTYKEETCYVKSGDISAKTQSFSLNSQGVEKIKAKKAIILAKGGLNMRKGPAVTYSKITTIPQYTVVNLEYSAGTYWYYATYNDKSGWVTGMDGYLGFDGEEVLIYYEPVKIYSTDGKTVLGTIPANTEITNYIALSGYGQFRYYVIYNNIKGYIDNMLYKTSGTGKIKLLKDVEIRDDAGELTAKLGANQELEYTMKGGTNSFYIPSKKIIVYLEDGQFEYVTKKDIVIKKAGYIGEGLFGEAKEEKKEEDLPKNEEIDESTKEEIIPKEEKSNIKDIIIIGLLAGIFAALTALVIIKLVNSKKKEVVPKVVKEEPKKEVESVTVSDQDIIKAREELVKEMQKKHEENSHDKEV